MCSKTLLDCATDSPGWHQTTTFYNSLPSVYRIPDSITLNSAVVWDTNDRGCLAFMDQYTLNLCYKWLDRVVQLCQQPRLQLKVSPPYLLDILPDLYEKLQAIVSRYQSDCSALYEIDYFRIFVHSLIERSEHTVRLFHETGDSMFDTQSLARHRLAKSALVFSHLLHDLRALFPSNTYAPSFRITKPDAAKWWRDCFGTRTIVTWTQFHEAFLCVFNATLSESRLRSLRNTIDLTCNLHVSIFEFDLFSRLFQPWCNIINVWTVLALRHPGYMAFMTYDEVKAILKPFRTDPGPGTYVFRLSCTKPGQWAIGYITEDRKIIQTIIQNKSLAQALLDGERRGFYLFPNGQQATSDLVRQLVSVTPQPHVRVTREQYQMYRDMGSTFEVCKICDEHNKDIQLEPCGHLICKQCLLHCQSVGRNRTCPFCRLEIKGVEEVIVDPYQPKSSKFQSSSSPLVDSLTANSNSHHCDTNSDAHLEKESNVTSCLSTMDPLRLTAENPPPVPPRNFLTLHSPHCALTDSHLLVSGSSTVNAFGEPLFGSLSYPRMMYADGRCLTPALNETDNMNNGALSSCSHATSTQSNREMSPLPTAFNLNYAQLDLLHSESDSDSLGRVTRSLKDWTYHRRKCTHTTELLDTALNRLSSDSVSDSHNFIRTHPHSSVDETLICELMSTHPDMDRSDAVLLLSITGNQFDMATQIWLHFVPRVKLPPCETS